jgi:uncharacterized membrane protein
MSRFLNLKGAASMRWLLPMSLAMNVLFVGASGAVALRYTGSVPLSTVARIDHSATDRLDHIAASLPMTDAQVLRLQIRADEEKVASAQADLRLSQEGVRETLRAEPFDLAAMQAAMEQVQVARGNYHMVLHEMIASAAPKMSVVGRNKLADWTATRDSMTISQ